MLSALLNQYGQETICKQLAPFLTDQRKETIAHMLTSRLDSLHIAFENPYEIHNIMAGIRSAEALGIFNIHLVNANRTKKRPTRSVTQGTERWVHLHSHKDLSTLPHCLAAATPSGTLSLSDLPVDRPLTLLFGNEHEGLSTQALSACTHTFHIPMYGMCQSFNLSVSVALTLYDLQHRRRSHLSTPGDLTPTQITTETAWAYLRTLGHRQASHILKSVARGEKGEGMDKDFIGKAIDH
ncbi:MAG: RNA methyltransferase [Chlamydiia bacterium]|nr:RNA methyltransferase [Chlamydiia bacterium]